MVDGALKQGDSSKDEHDLVVSGERRLLDFTADTEKQEHCSTRYQEKEGCSTYWISVRQRRIQLFIGQESGYRPLGDMSLVTSTYQLNGELAGALGVIGPTRMDYKVSFRSGCNSSALSAAMRRG